MIKITLLNILWWLLLALCLLAELWLLFWVKIPM